MTGHIPIGTVLKLSGGVYRKTVCETGRQPSCGICVFRRELPGISEEFLPCHDCVGREMYITVKPGRLDE